MYEQKTFLFGRIAINIIVIAEFRHYYTLRERERERERDRDREREKERERETERETDRLRERDHICAIFLFKS